MKILHIGKYAPPFFGGIENFMMALGQACCQQGLEVAAIVHHHQRGKGFEQQTMGQMTLFRVPCYGSLMFAPVSPGFGYYLQQVIKTFKPDLLHIHMPNTSAFFALLTGQAKQIPWVVHWHSDVLGDDSPWFLRTFYPCYRPFETAILNRASRVIATSDPYLATSVALNANADIRGKSVVIPLGLDSPAPWQPTQPTQPSNPLKLLIVGRLTYYKGHQYLIAALQILKQQGMVDIELNIVGSGEQQQKLADQIVAAGLQQQVHLLGQLSFEQLQLQFQQADLFCLPSIERTEAFGVVLMEAAAYGLPAIVADVPGSGMSYVVQHQHSGLVVARCQPQAWADAIASLYLQPDTLIRYGENAAQRFDQQFKIKGVADKTIALYREVIASGH